MRALKWLLVTAIAVGVILSLSPLALRYWVEQELAEVGIEAEFDRFELDYLMGELVLGGVKLATADGATLEVYELAADFNWRTIGTRRIALSSLVIDGAKVDEELLPPLTAVLSRRFGWVTGSGRTEQLQIARARLDNLEVCRQQRADCLHLEQGIATLLQLDFSQDGWELTSRGPVSITKAFLREEAGGSALFYLGEYRSANLALSRQRWRATEVSAVNLHLLENPGANQTADRLYQTQIGEFTTDFFDFSRDPWVLRFGVVQLISPRQALERNAEGALSWPEYFLARLPERRDTLTLSFDGLNIQGGALLWQDQLQTPPLRLSLNQLKAAIGPYSAERPAEFTPLELAFSIAPKGSVQLAGSVQNLVDPAALNIKLVFEQLQLAPVAAYISPLFGGTPSAGQLDMAVELDSRQDAYSGELRARFEGVEMANADGRVLAQQLKALDPGGGAVVSAPINLPETLELQQLPQALGSILRRRVSQLAAQPQ